MTKALIPAERRRRIREYLAAHQVATILDLSDLLRVSEATVRRDLAWLEELGQLERTHGGAVISQRLPTEPEYASSALTRPVEKELIGAAAAACVGEGDIVFLNSGSTTTQVLRQLHGVKNVTVITNNVSAVTEAASAEAEVVLLGGSFRRRAHSVVGRFATATLRQINASKAFIGVDGINVRAGCTTPIGEEAEIARLMIERTRGPVFVVADHSKWGVISNYEIAPLSRIHTLVTDPGFDAGARAELAAQSVEVIVAGASGSSRPGGSP